VYFVATYGQQAELWQTDGTSEGTRRVVELIPDLTMGAPTSLLVAGDGFYLTQSGTSGTELWKADPKVSRAELLWDSSKGSFRNPLLVLSDRRLFFTATDDDHGTELWVTDGTADGTHLVRDINRGNESTFISSSPDFQREWLQEYLGGLLFVAAEPSRGTELWFTDGTDAGTYPVADVRPGPAGSGIGSLYVSRDIIYFSANDGLHGFEPWVSDGSSRGTRMLANVDARTYGSDPAWPTRSGSDLFFAATASDGERRLWRWNPTTDSAAVVSEAVLNPTDLVDVDGTLYFSAFHPEYGRELWQTDGTAAGTRLVVDLVPGPNGSSPGNIAALNGDIYFSAVDEVHGREPWWLPALPGDANGDRRVDFADFADLASSFGGLGTRRDGDFNGDGMIDFEDFVILATNFG
jgi:ELWxxDGT repeat protein